MKIGCDIDDVTVKFVPAFLEIYKKKYDKDIQIKDIYSFDLWEPLGISKEAALDIAKGLFDSSVYDNFELVEGAKQGIAQLSKKNELFLLTARPVYAKEKTERYFQKKFPNNSWPVYFAGDFFNGAPRKSDLCKRIGITLIIEDNWRTAFECFREGIEVLLYDRPWNKCFEDIKFKNIKRVYNWPEILREVNNKNAP